MGTATDCNAGLYRIGIDYHSIIMHLQLRTSDIESAFEKSASKERRHTPLISASTPLPRHHSSDSALPLLRHRSMGLRPLLDHLLLLLPSPPHRRNPNLRPSPPPASPATTRRGSAAALLLLAAAAAVTSPRPARAAADDDVDEARVVRLFQVPLFASPLPPRPRGRGAMSDTRMYAGGVAVGGVHQGPCRRGAAGAGKCW